MYFLRSTAHPKLDLKRGFSGNVNAWFPLHEDARAYAERNGVSGGPLRCPISGRWCGDPEVGLSAFAFEDADGLAGAVRLIAPCVDGDTVEVFRSLDWDQKAGLDGEDSFRGGQHLFALSWPPTWESFEDAFEKWREDRYTNGRCHVLAIALHRLTGWPLAALLDHHEPFDEETPAVAHVYVVHPAGGTVDVCGLDLEERLLDRFECGDPEFVSLTADEIAAWAGDDGPLHAFCEADLALAAEDAAGVLETLDIPPSHLP